METLWGHHQSGHLDAAIDTFNSLDLTSASIATALNPDAYYYPNIRHNEISKPNTVQQDAIAVVNLKSGIDYHFKLTGLHLLQKLALADIGYSEAELDEIEDKFANTDGTISDGGGSPGAASVSRKLTAAAHHAGMSVSSLPVVIFNVDVWGGIPEDPTSVALHELVHVAQALSRPLWSGDRQNTQLQTELEAYSVQSSLVESYVVPYTLGTAMSGEVDMHRKKYLGKTVYKPTSEYIEAVRKHEIVCKILK